jgi:HPt (histidine-containing phosphotransfer) domain-containing protein
MSEADTLDQAALADLRAMTGDDPAFLAELIDTYVADTPQQLATIRRALDTGDAEAVRRAAHSLKSNSATFGAAALAGLGAQLEARGKAGELAGMDELVARAEAEYDLVKRALRALQVAGEPGA